MEQCRTTYYDLRREVSYPRAWLEKTEVQGLKSK